MISSKAVFSGVRGMCWLPEPSHLQGPRLSLSEGRPARREFQWWLSNLTIEVRLYFQKTWWICNGVG